MAQALTRRSFLMAGLSALGATTVLASSGCASSSDQDAQQTGSTQAAEIRQVIVAMNATSEPAAGFDPLVAWGCGEHVHEPLIQSTLITTNEDLAL